MRKAAFICLGTYHSHAAVADGGLLFFSGSLLGGQHLTSTARMASEIQSHLFLLIARHDACPPRQLGKHTFQSREFGARANLPRRN